MKKQTKGISLGILFVAVVVSAAVPRSAAGHAAVAEYHYESGGTCDDCIGSPRYHWDPYYSAHGTTYRYGALYQGTANMVYMCGQLRIAGVTLNAASYVARGDARGFSTQEWSTGNWRVTREVYVPEDGLDFMRTVDSIRNAGAGAANLTVEYYCQYYYGCSGGTECTENSSDGDGTAEATDIWFVNKGGTYAALGFLMYADGSDEEMASVTFTPWYTYTMRFDLNIAAGETQKLLTFMVQANDEDEAGATLDYLSVLPPEATVDWDAALPDFVNFVTDGRPAVSTGGPYRVPEGGEIILEPRIFDREGDALLWSWDLDGDGGFDDSSDLNPTLDVATRAEMADGDAEFTVSLYVVEDIDGGREVVRDADIEVVNVAPIVVSEPPGSARRGGEYRYVPAVADPAGVLDPYTLLLIDDEYPGGMAVVPGDLENPPAIVWTPNVADIAASPHHVEMEVEDEDGGLFTQAWDIVVTDNTAPFEPSLLYPRGRDCILVERPTMKLGNAQDLDDDPLTYFIEVDSDPAFRSIDLQASGPLPEGVSGFTEWQVPRPLTNGELYYWRAWVTDTIQESERIVEVFEVCLDGPEADSDVDTDVDTDADTDTDTESNTFVGGDGDGDGASTSSPGCACDTTASSSPVAPLAAFAMAAVLATRRRRGR